MVDRVRQTVVVLTALELEHREVCAHLSDLSVVRHPAGTIFTVGSLSGTPWRVVVAVTGDGNAGASVLAERAIATFSPRALLFVGIAGALHDDLRLGDVVVGTRVYAYHGGREGESGFSTRPRSWEASHELEQAARAVARETRWADGDEPAVYFRPIAAGEVLLDSGESQLALHLRSSYSDAAAIEMESAGMANAAHLNLALPALTVRGISDRAGGEKLTTDREGWPSRAAAHAAEFALSTLRQMPAEDGYPTPAGATSATQVNVANGGTVFAVQHGDQHFYRGQW